MPEKKAKGKGKGLSKKVGPLPLWGWGAVGVGTFLAWYLLKKYEADKAAANAALSTAAAPTTAAPLDTSAGGVTSTTTGTPTSLAAWESAALAYMTANGVSSGDALNAISNWLSGNCVDQAGYNGLSNAISALGIPPGLTTWATLTVCPTSGTGTGNGSTNGTGGGGTNGNPGTGGPASPPTNVPPGRLPPMTGSLPTTGNPGTGTLPTTQAPSAGELAAAQNFAGQINSNQYGAPGSTGAISNLNAILSQEINTYGPGFASLVGETFPGEETAPTGATQPTGTTSASGATPATGTTPTTSKTSLT